MKDQIISYKIAILAKEKGFNIPCRTTYNNSKLILAWYPNECYYGYGLEENMKDYYSNPSENLLAPSQSLLQRWLREVYNIHTEIFIYEGKFRKLDGYYYNIATPNKDSKSIKWITNNKNYKTYEGALEIGLQEALKLI